MGQNRITQTRSAPLILHDAQSDGTTIKHIIEGITNVSVPGPSSPRFPAGDVLDRVRKYAIDLPEPGVASFQLNFNGADPLHRRLYDFQKNHKTLKFEWRTQGKVKNGVKQPEATLIGTVSAAIAAGADGSAEQLLSFTTFSNDEPRVGDILAIGLAAGDKKYVVDRADYESSDKIQLVVKEVTVDAAGKITVTDAPAAGAKRALVAAKTYFIYEPSVSQVFVGEISGVPSGGAQFVVAGVSVNIADEIMFNVIGPKLAGG